MNFEEIKHAVVQTKGPLAHDLASELAGLHIKQALRIAQAMADKLINQTEIVRTQDVKHHTESIQKIPAQMQTANV